MVISTAYQKARGRDNAQWSLEVALAAAKTAIENRGQEVLVLDTRNQTSLFDYFVIATGTSRRQLHAMSDEIDHKLADEMYDRRMGIEGYDESRWIVLDYGDVVVHLFDAPSREYYSLEELWGDSPRVKIPGKLPV